MMLPPFKWRLAVGALFALVAAVLILKGRDHAARAEEQVNANAACGNALFDVYHPCESDADCDEGVCTDWRNLSRKTCEIPCDPAHDRWESVCFGTLKECTKDYRNSKAGFCSRSSSPWGPMPDGGHAWFADFLGIDLPLPGTPTDVLNSAGYGRDQDLISTSFVEPEFCSPVLIIGTLVDEGCPATVTSVYVRIRKGGIRKRIVEDSRCKRMSTNLFACALGERDVVVCVLEDDQFEVATSFDGDRLPGDCRTGRRDGSGAALYSPLSTALACSRC